MPEQLLPIPDQPQAAPTTSSSREVMSWEQALSGRERGIEIAAAEKSSPEQVSPAPLPVTLAATRPTDDVPEEDVPIIEDVASQEDRVQARLDALNQALRDLSDASLSKLANRAHIQESPTNPDSGV